MPATNPQIKVTLTPEQRAVLDQYRRAAALAGEADAIRDLVRFALEAKGYAFPPSPQWGGKRSSAPRT